MLTKHFVYGGKMKIKINYPSEQSGVEKLNEVIAEFKATLYIESINNLNVSEETKKQILKNLIQVLNYLLKLDF